MQGEMLLRKVKCQSAFSGQKDSPPTHTFFQCLLNIYCQGGKRLFPFPLRLSLEVEES